MSGALGKMKNAAKDAKTNGGTAKKTVDAANKVLDVAKKNTDTKGSVSSMTETGSSAVNASSTVQQNTPQVKTADITDKDLKKLVDAIGFGNPIPEGFNIDDPSTQKAITLYLSKHPFGVERIKSYDELQEKYGKRAAETSKTYKNVEVDRLASGKKKEEEQAAIESEDEVKNDLITNPDAGENLSSTLSTEEVKNFQQAVREDEKAYRDLRAEDGTLGTGGTVEEQKKTAEQIDEKRGVGGRTPDQQAQVDKIVNAAEGETLEKRKKQNDTQVDTEVDTKEEAEDVIEQATKEVSTGENPSNKFWDAWKSGKFDMYPTMKALADSIAKNARMTMDRAALLTGGQRDYEAYNPIETEQDKTRDIQREERAGTPTGQTNAEVVSNFQNAKTPEEKEAAAKDIGNLIATGKLDYETAVKGLSASDVDTLNKYIGYSEKKEDLTVTQQKAGTKQMLIQNKATIQENIRTIDSQIIQLEEAKRQLAGNDVEAYSKAANAYMSVRSGIESIGSASTSQSSGSGSAGLDIPLVNLGGSFTSGEGSTATRSLDTLAAAALPTADQWGKMSMEEQNEANAKMEQQIDQQITELKQLKAQWQGEFKSITGENL